MKARIKATGEIVEARRICQSSQGPIWEAEGCDYYEYELDFDIKESPKPPYDPDYWTRLEHQAAIATMGGICGNASYSESSWEDMAEDAIRAAHALIQKLKEKNKKRNGN
jgi:hypothetical protein